jgi:glycerol-3-phosphate acyltransferase PlsX
VIITDDDTPVVALRQKKQSSMYRAVESMYNGEANAVVSAGNTGALMVISKMLLGTLEGIKRPAIVGMYPTKNAMSVMLDLGANTDCNDSILSQFALMGVCFAKVVLNKDKPSVGLLNVGVEQIKGRELERKTFEVLQDSGLNFAGYIEGHDIAMGKVDVIVTDGFSGNLVLKASEGAANLFIHLLKGISRDNGITAKLAMLMLKPYLKNTLSKIDPDKHNGAMFIGLNGITVKSHGGATHRGMLSAINVAVELVRRNINFEILRELKFLEEKGVGTNLFERIKSTSVKFLGITK